MNAQWNAFRADKKSTTTVFPLHTAAKATEGYLCAHGKQIYICYVSYKATISLKKNMKCDYVFLAAH
jgi:hypothetical protein